MSTDRLPFGNLADTARLHVPLVDSTNDEAMRQANAGRALPFWVTADRQSGGRGRRGRQWVSDRGNVFASLACAGASLPGDAWRLPLVCAVAVHDAIAAIVGSGRSVTIKWPNDVLVDGAKISGILVEQHQTGVADVVIAGIGVNVASKPDLANYPVACLTDFGPAPSPDSVWRSLADHLEASLECWARPDGFDEIRSRWLAKAACLGRNISVNTGAGSECGVFVTIDPEGRLVLRGEDGGTRVLSAGDIRFGNED